MELLKIKSYYRKKKKKDLKEQERDVIVKLVGLKSV